MDFANIILQTIIENQSFDVSWIALGISAISAIAVCLGFILNWKRLGRENAEKEYTILSEITEKISWLNQEITNFESPLSLSLTLGNYMNVAEQLAFLCNHNKISSDIGNYFRVVFSQSMMYERMLNESKYKLSKDETSFDEIHIFAEKHNIEAPHDVRPVPSFAQFCENIKKNRK